MNEDRLLEIIKELYVEMLIAKGKNIAFEHVLFELINEKYPEGHEKLFKEFMNNWEKSVKESLTSSKYSEFLGEDVLKEALKHLGEN